MFIQIRLKIYVYETGLFTTESPDNVCGTEAEEGVYIYIYIPPLPRRFILSICLSNKGEKI